MCRFWKPKNGRGDNFASYIHLLSGNNRALPICSRIEVVMTLVLEVWHSMIVARCKHTGFNHAVRVALWTEAAKLLQ